MPGEPLTSAADATGTVTHLRRPPVRVSTLVRSDAGHTFDAFVRTIGTWWPVDPFSAGQNRVRDVTIERERGGRVYERWDDGTAIEWGELVAWEPPQRFVMTWCGTPVATEVELTFVALGPSLTRVSVEHRGWEQMTEEQLAEDCALPGGYTGGAYNTGWHRILGSFADAIERDGQAMAEVTDEYMLEMRDKSKAYTLMMLRQGPRYSQPDRDQIIWEHGRRNHALRLDGVLAIVCPIPDESEWCGIGIFDASPEDVVHIMDGDPGVQAGVFEYEVHAVRGFPGDMLAR